MAGVGRLVQIDLDAAGEGAGYERALADGRLWCDRATDATARAAPRPGPPLDHRPEDDGWRAVYSGPGELEGGRRELATARAADGRWRIRFDDGDEYQVESGPAGARILRGRCGTGPPPDRAVERALGAPLALALAEGGIWLLHAAAIERDGRAVALVGASGAGKSTLAAAAPAVGARRVADDQLPVRGGEAPRALPRFPQLKLAGRDGDSAPPAELELAACAVLARDAAAARPRLERLDAAPGTLALVRATVAAKLFDDELLARHIRSCAEIARAAPVARFVHPPGLDLVEAALDWLLEEAIR